MPQIANVAVFPPDNFWNVAVDTLPLIPNSAAMMAVVNASGNEHLHLDDVIPITLINASQPMQHVSGMGDDSDPGLYPIPDNVAIEAGDDLHAIVLDTDSGVAYEFYSLRPSAVPGYKWHADSGVKWDLASNAMRTIPGGSEPEISSADAGGLPILPGLLRYEEVAAGSVTHALRVTCRRTAYAHYIWPATHFTRGGTDPNDPPFGTRFRLKASFDVSGFSPMNQTILRGMKKYGLVVADNGMYGGCQHDQDARWGNNQVAGTPGADLLALHLVSLSNFEAVDCSGLMVDSNYMQAGAPTQGLVGTDRLGRRTPVALDSAFAIRGGKLFLAGNTVVTPPVPPVPIPAPVLGDSAVFVKQDVATGGAWQGVYGAGGFNVIMDREQYPGYATVTVTGKSDYVWASATNEARALRKPSAPAVGIAACWYDWVGFGVEVRITDGQQHKLAVYLLDWDQYIGGRVQSIEVFDGAGKLLDTRSVSGFSNGLYLQWQVSGRVVLRIKNTGNHYANAVLSGLFFD